MGVSQTELVQILLSERPRLLAYINIIVRSHAMAEDVFQDVATMLIEKQDHIENEQHLRGWLRLTARNLAFAGVRRESKHPVLLSSEAFEVLDIELDKLPDEPQGEKLDALQDCVNRLSQYARRIVSCRYGQSLTGDRLAAALGRPKSAVYRALARIHKALLECVRERLSGSQA